MISFQSEDVATWILVLVGSVSSLSDISVLWFDVVGVAGWNWHVELVSVVMWISSSRVANLSTTGDDDAASRLLLVSDDTTDRNAVDVVQWSATGNGLVCAATWWAGCDTVVWEMILGLSVTQLGWSAWDWAVGLETTLNGGWLGLAIVINCNSRACWFLNARSLPIGWMNIRVTGVTDDASDDCSEDECFEKHFIVGKFRFLAIK